MADMPSISQIQENTPRSFREAADEVAREIGVRKKCYDRWVAEGKLSYSEAVDRMMRLKSALHYMQDPELKDYSGTP